MCEIEDKLPLGRKKPILLRANERHLSRKPFVGSIVIGPRIKKRRQFEFRRNFLLQLFLCSPIFCFQRVLMSFNNESRRKENNYRHAIAKEKAGNLFRCQTASAIVPSHTNLTANNFFFHWGKKIEIVYGGKKVLIRLVSSVRLCE